MRRETEDVFAQVPRRIIPALPMEDPLLGEIRWDRWERALEITICLAGGRQAETDCETCGWRRLRTTQGMTFWQPKPGLARAARSTQTRSGRSKWVAVQRKAYWVYTHWAVFCPACDEMTAWRRVDPNGEDHGVDEWTAIFHHPPTTERALPPAEGTLF